MSIEAPQPSNDAAAGGGITLSMQAVYLKDCSFEAPLGPRITGEWSPQIGLDINTAVSNISGDLHEVLLTVTVSAKQGEQTMFIVEVKQAGALPAVTKYTLAVSSRSSPFHFSVTGPAGSNCVIQVSTNLISWTPLSTNRIPAGGAVKLEDPEPSNQRGHFFRAAQ